MASVIKPVRDITYQPVGFTGDVSKEQNHAPETSQNLIVFPWKSSTRKYDTRNYGTYPNHAARVTKSEIMSVLNSLKTDKYYIPPSTSNVCIVIPVVTGILLILLLILILAIVYSFNQIWGEFYTASIILTLFAILVGISTIAYALFSKKNTLRQRFNSIQRRLDMENEDGYLARDMRWDSGPYASWVLLSLGGPTIANAVSNGPGYVTTRNSVASLSNRPSSVYKGPY